MEISVASPSETDPLFCPTETALGMIGGKWKGMILWCICRKTMRFNELHRTIPSISQRMLTKQLRELEDHGIIRRKVYPEIPPRVEYSLSAHGQSLKPILDQLEDWSRDYLTEKLGRGE
jgi:DNA-binding HxlR family transcriptional regulator